MSSASTIGSNDDLITEILTRLPVIAILRCKGVNKQWRDIISQRSFPLLHSLRHPSPLPSGIFHFIHSSFPAFAFVSLSPSPSPSSPPPLSLPSPFNIVHSSNGLITFISDSRVVVSNPTTLSTLSLPFPPIPANDLVVGVALAFHPARCPGYYILLVAKKHHTGSYYLRVYHSSTSSWAADEICLGHAPFDVEFDRGVYWNGRVLWLSHTGRTVYYELESGCVKELVLPEVFDEGTYLERFRYFGESCGHLHLVEIRTNCVREFEVLELEEKEGGELGWFVKFKVDLDVVGRGFEFCMFQDGVDRFGRRLRFYAFSILAVIHGNGDDDDVSAIVLSIPGKLISYNIKNKVSRLLCDVVDQSDKWLPFRGYNGFQFIESLYCL